MFKQFFSNRTQSFKQITAIIVIIMVAIAGTIILKSSNAASSYISINADKGTVANGATVQACSGASDGNCVKFGSSGGGGNLVYYGSFDTSTFNSGTSSNIDPKLWAFNSSVPGHVSVMADPLGSGKKVLKFAIADSDRQLWQNGQTSYTSPNPRADVGTAPYLFTAGKDYYISLSILIPSDTPLFGTGGSSFYQWAETYYPGTGSPVNPTGFGAGATSSDKTHNHFQMGVPYSVVGRDTRAWLGPLIDGKWHTAITHIHFADCGPYPNGISGAKTCDSSQSGFVELWWDGTQQTFVNGSQRLYGQTLSQAPNGQYINDQFINSYRAAGVVPGTVTTYHGSPAIGTTLQSVENTLSSPQGP